MFFSSLNVIITTDNLTTFQKYQFLKNSYICLVLSHTYKLIKHHLIFAIAFLCASIVYYKFLFLGHISWDDPEMVFKNNAVKNFDLKALFTNHYVGNYIPITMLFHSIAWFCFDTWDGGHHLFNILLHLFNGILVYQLGKRLFKNELITNIGAFVFLLHPLQIESVAWIGELKNVLSSTFYLAGLLTYLNFVENEKKKSYLFTLLFFILGCLSKSSVVVLPLSLICLDIFKHQKISIKYLINKIPFLILSILFGAINLKTQSADLFINHSHEFAYWQRFGLAGFGVTNYLVLFLFPTKLSVIYPYPELKGTVFFTGFFMLFILISALIYLLNKKNYTVIAIVFFVLSNLILVLQFVPFGEVLYADRYVYLPIIGLAWLVAYFISKLKINAKLISVLLICTLTIFSYARSNTWNSAIALYENILQHYPKQFVALNSAGVESMFLNEDRKALQYFNEAIRSAPYNYKAFYNRGLLHLKNKKPLEAIESFNESLKLYDYQKAYVGRASAYYMLGDISKAMNDANRIINLENKNAKAHFVLGNCYNDLNKLNEAMNEYNKCIELNNEEADFYFKRAIVFGKKQEFKSCLNDLLVCIELRPD